MQAKVNESDWKLFRSRMTDWQEAYMDRLNQEYIALLSAPGDASDKWSWRNASTGIRKAWASWHR